MQTNITRLQFILRFAAMALPTLRAGDLVNLREDILDLITGYGVVSTLPHRGGIVAFHEDSSGPNEITLQDLETLQAEVQTLVAAVMVRDDAPRAMTKDLLLEARYTITTQGMLLVEGPLRDIVLLITIWLLHNTAVHSILRCLECDTIFHRFGKRKYCTSVCSNRANLRQWRAKEGNREKTRDKAHKVYEAKKTAARATR